MLLFDEPDDRGELLLRFGNHVPGGGMLALQAFPDETRLCGGIDLRRRSAKAFLLASDLPLGDAEQLIKRKIDAFLKLQQVRVVLCSNGELPLRFQFRSFFK